MGSTERDLQHGRPRRSRAAIDKKELQPPQEIQMSWLNSAIKKIAPIFALKREIATRRLARLQDIKSRSFEATVGGRLRYDFLTTSKSADGATKDDIGTLRSHVRQLEYNSGNVAGPIQRITTNVVGQGIKFQARIKKDDPYARTGGSPISEQAAKKTNAQIEKLFKRWTKKADTKLTSTFYELQALAEAALIRDGEALVVGRESARTDRAVRYCLQILEADRLQTPAQEITNPKIRNGIEFDAEGAPKTYYLLKQHPGDAMSMALSPDDFEEVPAFYPNGTKKVIHLFNPVRPEQTRGYTRLAAGLKDLQDLDRYREAELMAALEDACMTGVVTTEAPTAWQQASTKASGSEEYDRIQEFAPGEWHYLAPGEKVDIHSPKRPNDAFGEFNNQLIRGPANALDIPPEIMSQNWAGMNYSNARTVLLMFYAFCRLQQQYLKTHLCEPVYEVFLNTAIATGKLTIPGYATRKADYQEHAWIAPGWQWVDPVKEAKGKEIEVQNNFATLTDICAAQGLDFEEVIETRARELQKIQEQEKEKGITFPSKTGPPAPPETSSEPGNKKTPNLQAVK